jgi:hypothetical protein
VLSERDLRILDEIEGNLARDPRLVRALAVQRVGRRWRLGCDLAIGFSLTVSLLCLVLAANGTLGSAALAATVAAAIAVVRHRRFRYRTWSSERRSPKRPAMP